MSQNVIELNGKRYDASTGAFLGTGSAKAAMAHVATHTGKGKAIDGFIRHPVANKGVPIHKPAHHASMHDVVPVRKPVVASVHKPKAAKAIEHPILAELKAAAAVPPTKPAIAFVPAAPSAHQHNPAATMQHHRPQHAKTLMRHTVHKPEITIKPAIKPQAPAEVMAKPASALAHKPAASAVDPARLARAQATAKHTSVRRFQPHKLGAEPVHHTVTRMAVIPVRPQPAHEGPVHIPDIFETAMRNARSHEQLPVKHKRSRRSRLANTAALVGVFLVLGGFITYLNLPNIQLHIASMQAGFKASIPSYKPTGYALRGGVSHEGGTVSLRFGSGDSSYTITEQSSNWNSQSLLDNTLALTGPHQTLLRDGRTVYVYGNGSNASWVTGQVRYDITGNAVLSADQLANIAASM